MTELNLPLVKEENELHKTFRMLFTVGIIIIGMFFLVSKYAEYQNGCDFAHQLETLADEINTPASILPLKYYNKTFMAKSITIYNLSHKMIPVEQIAIIGEDRVMRYMPLSAAVLTGVGKEGINITFELPSPIALRELIIDVGEIHNIQNTIITSQVEIRDADGSVIWRNENPLKGGVRYNYLKLHGTEVEGPAPHISHKGMGPYNEIDEYDLGDTLQKNTWS
jgi:hypothetical protein